MTVYLVGAGPGDPGLLTVRAAELLASADVVVHDRLSAPGLLALAPEGADIRSVGKDPHGLSVPQEDINDLLVELGSAGLEVVRLKGGDPYVFARGAEEALALEAAGIDYEVVPGISSAIAAPAYAGIPVTMRYSSTSVTIVTGHEDPKKAKVDVGWEALAQVGGTIVILMGVANIGEISRRLLAGGLPGSTPVAAVRWGTRPDQSVIRSTLAEIPSEPLRSPSTIVVGEVARQSLDWFTRRPLFGTKVAVTRSAAQVSQLATKLRRVGAEVIEVPTIEIVDSADGGVALRAAVSNVRDYEWVILTSPNGARRFCAELRDGRDLAGVKLAAIGPGTAAVLAEYSLVADLQPERFVAESLLDAFPLPDWEPGSSSATGPGHEPGSVLDSEAKSAVGSGPRVLIPRAAVGRDVLPNGLRDRGWVVDVVEAYQTVPRAPTEAESAALATAEVVTFTSASSVRNLLASIGSDKVPSTVVTIGPITTEEARAAGLTVDVEAEVHTIAGLVDALVDSLVARRSAQ
ncbi:MAG TPA: uroporphyrinogen-III C-methyltransferase [Microthrixaceae bacterium]|nr:uroporphyrinogen-III C-methyltransferase [Microthrixaceae bacterium]